MSDFAIQVENLSKRYRIGLKEQQHDTLAGAGLAWLKSPITNFQRLRKLSRFNEHEPSDDIIWALKDVSFRVHPGEVVGIIGRNGAGKSTLLKVLSRITPPTKGRVILNGRVASLLEVGTGFHPEMTGRENIYLNGTILGMSKTEVDHKFDEIVAFAEVEKFIDTPVKRYSSGMRMRLAFAVAAHLEPEILLVDEVLAVGDAAFQKKCLGRMENVARSGRTVLFVSHNMGAITRLCPETFWIHKGHLQMTGPTDQVISQYLAKWANLNGKYTWEEGIAGPDVDEFKLREVRLKNEMGVVSSSFDVRKSLWVEVEYETIKRLPYCRIGIIITTIGGVTVFDSYDADQNAYLGPREPGIFVSRCEVPGNLLSPGRYVIFVNAGMPGIKNFIKLENVLFFDIHDTGAIGSHIGGRRRGIIRPKLSWQINKIL